jgi:Family of unknown function (DUF5681)
MNKKSNPKSLANLKPWQPGQSGNPGGRPKRLLAEAYQTHLGCTEKGDAQKRTYAELIALAQIRKALRGNTMAAKEIADRTEGRARQAIELTAPEGQQNFKITVRYVKSESMKSIS